MAAARAPRLALRGKEKRLISLVYAKATPEQFGVWLRPALECAINARDFSTTVALLKAGANSCLGAEEAGRLRELLLSHPTYMDKDGDSTIHAAVLLEDELLVDSLLRKGADKEAPDSYGRSPLHLAIQHSSYSAVKALLAAGADPTLRCPDDGCAALDMAAIHGEVRIISALLAAVGPNGVNATCAGRGLTALHRAAFHDQLPSVGLLLQAGARVDATDRDGWTPLFDACAEGSTDVIASLLWHGASRRRVDRKGRGLLHVAAERGHLPAVIVLLESGRIDVDRRYGNSQSSALDVAAIAGHVDVLRALVEHGGAQVNSAVADGRTTCHRAAFFNQPAIIDELFRAGADLEAKTHRACTATTGSTSNTSTLGWSPIFDAAAEGSTEAVVALLKHKAKHSARDSDGRTPLHLAAEADHAGVCSALLAGGANPFLRYGDSELSALDVAVREGNLDIVLAIIEFSPAGLNSADSGGYTALHHASSRGAVPEISALLEAGAEVDAKDCAGWTPLFEASTQGSCDAVAVLLHHGANAKALDFEGRSPLHLAAQRGFVGTTRRLLTAGADVGRRFGRSECSALDLAVVDGHVEVLRSIIATHRTAAEELIDGTDSLGRTALHRAAFFNQPEALAVLVEGGASASVLDSHGRTPLDVATARGSKEAAEMLSTTITATIAAPAAAAAPPPPANDNANNNRRGGEECFAIATAASTMTAPAKQAPTALMKRVHFGDGSPDRSREYVNLLQKRAESAPADRAWRRRRLLVLCRVHPERLRLLMKTEAGGKGGLGLGHDGSSREGTGGGGAEGRSAKVWPLRASSVADCSRNTGGGDVIGLITRVLLLKEDGLFRLVVGFL